MKTDVIYHGDCVKVLKSLDDDCADLVATDPPFNIGMRYDVYDDRREHEQYLAWTEEWLAQCARILKPTGSLFICIGDEYQAEINLILKKMGLIWRNTLIWYYTFGQNQKNKFNRCHTTIHYFAKSAESKFFPDAIRVPSLRQIKYKDKRANAGGKLPDDVWESTEHNDPAPSALPDDVWRISRLCGTFKERILREDGSAHPCQMPLPVMDRIIKCCTEPGDLVIDPFAGTGTTAHAAQALDRRFITMDISECYAEVVAARLGLEGYVTFPDSLRVAEKVPA